MGDKKIVYAVGEYIKETEDGAVWDLAGIFEDQSKAEAACVKDNYFVGPMPLNTALPTKREVWPNVYYPTLEGRK